MAQLGRPLPESMAAALLTLGNAHAPITQACRLWNLPHVQFCEQVCVLYGAGQKIPGWGSSFAPLGEADSMLAFFDEAFPPSLLKKRDDMTGQVQAIVARPIMPNAALYTAMFADLLAMSPEEAPRLAILGRANVWTDIWKDHLDTSVQ
jgi:hypothetical protein